ncbi:MAG: type II toxin-antitoxin system HicA family toxin, partial [Lachnospiraceae bacterium]|nr:type II toxin-antitoxin system HicA family toxin [Lachnospiraceae bacterium]
EIRKILEHYGYKVSSNGSSHFVFRKNNCNPITIPVHGKIKSKYIEMVRDVIEQEEKE